MFTHLTEDQDVAEQIDTAEREALEYVRNIKVFYTHALTYLLVNVFLLVINLMYSPGYLWVLWVAAGWGIGLVTHWAAVFGIVNLFGPEWERRQVEKRLRQIRR